LRWFKVTSIKSFKWFLSIVFLATGIPLVRVCDPFLACKSKNICADGHGTNYKFAPTEGDGITALNVAYLLE
jgi:hypothetical protein